MTALQALRDKGKLQAGQSVLVNGAAGGVGSFAWSHQHRAPGDFSVRIENNVVYSDSALGTGAFSPITTSAFRVSAGTHRLEFSLFSSGFWYDWIDDVQIVPANEPTSATWTVDSNGNWSAPANWSGGLPNAAGAQVLFGGIITAPRAVTVDVPVTVGRIDFDSTNSYTITGAMPLTLTGTTGDTEIDVAQGSHTISAPITLADNTFITVTPETSNVSISGAVNGGGATVTKNGAGTVTVNQFRAATLLINSGKVVVAQDGTPDTPVLGALSIGGGGTFDVTNNAAVVDYSSTSPVDTIRQQIKTARGGSGFGATWTGMGITSSAAAAANAAEPESRSIGYAENSALPLGPYTDFRGQAVDDTSVVMAHTRTGDANLDGVVNDDDVTIVGATYAPGVPQPHWALGDFDYNGFVDDDDATLLGVFYNPGAPPIGTQAISADAATGVAVPEPATITLLAMMLFAWAAACTGLTTSVTPRLSRTAPLELSPPSGDGHAGERSAAIHL